MKPDPKTPYNDLPHLPADLDFGDRNLLLATLEATEAVARLKTMLTISSRTIQNTLDLLSPLFVPEAVSSSGIENIITTNDSVYVAKILKEREFTPAEKEALNYTEALLEGANRIDSQGFLATNDYLALQKTLEPNKQGIRKNPGTQLANPVTGAVYYTPPVGEKLIRDLLKNFEDYFNQTPSVDEVFARMAILHYQFEAIHPFVDGNGRTGRMLMPLYLMKHDRLPVPVLFISHYILEHRDEYYTKLRAVTSNGAWGDWVLFIANATSKQAIYTCGVLEKIRISIHDVKTALRGKSMYSSELVDFLFSNAYFTQKGFEQEVGVSPMTARKYLLELESDKIVFKTKQTGRNRYLYITPRYIDILKQA